MPRHNRTLLLVEDEPMLAGLLRDTFTAHGFAVHVASNALEGSRLARLVDPDVAVLDINLGPGESGVELAFILDRQHPGIALMLLTRHPDLRTAGYTQQDVPAGCGFIRKDMVTDGASIVAAVEGVLAEQGRVRQDADPARPLSELTSMQIEVLRLVAQGYTNAEIARRRKRSLSSVEQMLNSIFHTLGIASTSTVNPRVEAVRRFIEAAGMPDRA